MSTLRVAAVQAAPVFMDLGGTVEKTIALMEDAARAGVQLLAFPETWVPGYPFWLWLESPAGSMRFVGEYHANSITADGPEDLAIAAAAGRLGVTVSLGVSERHGGSLYMGQWLYGPEGRVLARRRKLKPTHVERTLFGEGDGSDLRVVDTPLGRIGSLCCWEHLQPLTKYAMYSQFEQIHIAAWPSFSLYEGAAYALGPEVNTAASQLYAAEGQCFVLAACAVVSGQMIEKMCDSSAKRTLLRTGGGYARLFGPDGAPLGAPLAPDQEGLVIADIDLGAIAYAKTAADPVGHYSRPDVLRLMFNPGHNPRVVTFDANFEYPGRPGGST
jgi:aliphatic nitrilase